MSDNRVPSFGYELYEMLNAGRFRSGLTPLYLGGTVGPGGGTGTPPGGFIGRLIQTQVTYDTTEAGVSSGSESLLDNLNHIRFRLGVLESGGGNSWTLGPYPPGAIPFGQPSGGSLIHDSVDLFWDQTYDTLLIGRDSMLGVTPSQAEKLHIYDDTISPTFRMYSAGNTAGRFGRIGFMRARGDFGSLAAIQSGDFLGQIFSAPYDGSSWLTASARMDFVANQDISSGSQGQRLDFYSVPDNTSNPALGMRLTGDGLYLPDRLGVGDVPTLYSRVYAQRNVADDAPYIGIRSRLDITATGNIPNNVKTGMLSEIVHTTQTVAVGGLTGFTSRIQMSSGSVQTFKVMEAQFVGDVSTARITDLYGLHVLIGFDTVAPTVSSLYGIYISDMFPATVRRYGIYQQGANDWNHFGGRADFDRWLELKMSSEPTPMPTTGGSVQLWGDSSTGALSYITRGNTQRAVDGSVYRQNTSGSVSNSAAETSLVVFGVGNRILGPNFLRNGNTIRVKAGGRYAYTGTPTIVLSLYANSSQLLSTTVMTTTGTPSGGVWNCEFEFTVYSLGSSGFGRGACKAQWIYNPASGLVQISGGGNGSNVAIDTTIAQTIDLRVQWGTASVSNVIHCDALTIEVLG